MSTTPDYRESIVADSPRRFVVLFHIHPVEGDHYDVMIEWGRILRTWRVARHPENATRDGSIDCEAIGDHRIVYLDYEGPVSGNRGHVTRYDAGHCRIVEESIDRIVIEFAGRIIEGRFVLKREPDTAAQWRLFRA
jgi:hypothetical protein